MTLKKNKTLTKKIGVSMFYYILVDKLISQPTDKTVKLLLCATIAFVIVLYTTFVIIKRLTNEVVPKLAVVFCRVRAADNLNNKDLPQKEE